MHRRRLRLEGKRVDQVTIVRRIDAEDWACICTCGCWLVLSQRLLQRAQREQRYLSCLQCAHLRQLEARAARQFSTPSPRCKTVQELAVAMASFEHNQCEQVRDDLADAFGDVAEDVSGEIDPAICLVIGRV